MTVALRRMAEIRARWAKRPETWEIAWWLPGAGPAPAQGLQRALYTHGEPAWGWVLVGWNGVYERGAENGPATLISSDDPAIQADPSLLRVPHDRYWTIRTNGATAPGLRRLVPWARREAPPVGRGRFPALLSGPWLVWEARIDVDRAHLPGGLLRSPLVPIVRFPDPRRAEMMILPRWHWPQDMVEEWGRG